MTQRQLKIDMIKIKFIISNLCLSTGFPVFVTKQEIQFFSSFVYLCFYQLQQSKWNNAYNALGIVPALWMQSQNQSLSFGTAE